MYNILHGQNPQSTLLLGMLGLDQTRVGRFRDAWITDEGVAIFTRNGGGNRECWCESHRSEDAEIERLKKEGKWETMESAERARALLAVTMWGTLEPKPDQLHEAGCLWVVNHELVKHPLYIKDEDDGFDETYATFYFRTPPNWQRHIDELRAAQPGDAGKSLKEKFDGVVKEMEGMTPDELEKKYPDLAKPFKTLAEELSK